MNPLVCSCEIQPCTNPTATQGSRLTFLVTSLVASDTFDFNSKNQFLLARSLKHNFHFFSFFTKPLEAKADDKSNKNWFFFLNSCRTSRHLITSNPQKVCLPGRQKILFRLRYFICCLHWVFSLLFCSHPPQNN